MFAGVRRVGCAWLAAFACAAAAAAAADDGGWRALPGSPPVPVIGRVGATPQLAERADPASANFRPDPALAALGRRIFNDTRLSEPRGMSCASCHDPARAFSPTLTAAALAGPRVPQGSRPGRFAARNAPSLLYVRYVPSRYFYQDEDAPAPAPFGGLFADGRADSLPEQARGPLFAANEMNNASPAALLRKIRGTDLGSDLAGAFGADVLRDPQRTTQALGRALEAYLQSEEMAPFSSRFDAFLTRHTPLAPAEMRGLALFRNPEKGNCASCHTMNESSSRPERSLFTDFGYEALGVPRNAQLAANRDPRHFDTGLDVTARRLRWPQPVQWCGYFRTPSLRNVAVRESLMHNGSLRSLRDAVAFYATRPTDPAHWFGGRDAPDDVPQACRANVNATTMPLNRRKGGQPALTEAEIDDLVAFLKTLTDAPYAGLMRP